MFTGERAPYGAGRMFTGRRRYRKEVSGIITQANYIEKLKRHNEKALEYVIRTYGGYVKAAVHRNLAGHPEEIEECMDDVFMDVWNNIDRFDENRSTFRNWICAIARFRSIDYLRRINRRISKLDALSSAESVHANDSANAGGGAQTETERIMRELSEKTEDLVRGISEEDRDILLRYYCMEDSAADIAEDYGVAEGTVYSRVSRAKSKLRQRRGGEIS